MTKLDHDDPKWTAYVLGELDDAQMSELKFELDENPATREYVTSLRETTDWLQTELGGAAVPTLTDAQRAAIVDAAASADMTAEPVAGPDAQPDAEPDARLSADAEADNVISLRPARRHRWLLGGAGLAAAAALVLIFPSGKKKEVPQDRVAAASKAERPGDPGVAAVLSDPNAAAPLSGQTGQVFELGDQQENGIANIEGLLSTSDSTAVAANKNGVVAIGASGHGQGRYPTPVAGVAPQTTSGLGNNGYYWGNRTGDVGAANQPTRLALATIPMAAKSTTEAFNSDPPPPDSEISATDTASKPRDADGDSVADNRKANTEAYDHIVHNPFVAVADDPRSTFSIDVDTAAYANMRRYLTNGTRPPAGAVRIEELVNYFSYRYEGPKDPSKPFAVHVEMAPAPWNQNHKLMKIGIKGKELVTEQASVQPTLVFLHRRVRIDGIGTTSCLCLQAVVFSMLVERIYEPDDRVAIAIYAGASRVWSCPRRPGGDKRTAS